MRNTSLVAHLVRKFCQKTQTTLGRPSKKEIEQAFAQQIVAHVLRIGGCANCGTQGRNRRKSAALLCELYSSTNLAVIADDNLVAVNTQECCVFLDD